MHSAKTDRMFWEFKPDFILHKSTHNYLFKVTKSLVHITTLSDISISVLFPIQIVTSSWLFERAKYMSHIEWSRERKRPD